jgi:4Fe-4S ferredoxin
MELILDKNKCTGCGICVRVCPKEAIQRGPIGAFKRFPEDLTTNLFYSDKCVYCGLCVYLCPFSALTLKVNGNIIETSEIPIVQEKAVPNINFKIKKLENKKVVKQYLKGKISINIEKCPGGCSTCVEVCPSKAISAAPKPDNGWEPSAKVQVNSEKCLYCGACANSCPVDAINLKITEVKYSGEFNEPFWPNLLDKLKKLKIEQ